MPAITSQIHTDVGPPVQTFPLSELENELQKTEKGKKRKPPVDLEKCKLMQLMQYDCRVVRKGTEAEVECRPIQRLFRQYVAHMPDSTLSFYNATDWFQLHDVDFRTTKMLPITNCAFVKVRRRFDGGDHGLGVHEDVNGWLIDVDKDISANGEMRERDH